MYEKLLKVSAPQRKSPFRNSKKETLWGGAIHPPLYVRGLNDTLLYTISLTMIPAPYPFILPYPHMVQWLFQLTLLDQSFKLRALNINFKIARVNYLRFCRRNIAEVRICLKLDATRRATKIASSGATNYKIKRRLNM